MTAAKTVKQAKKPIDFIGYFLRIAIIITLVCLFVPALNPTRMSELMNEGDSFFTSGVSYDGIAGGFQRAISRGYIEKNVLVCTYIGSLVSLVGMAAMLAGCAMTIGEIRFKRLGAVVSLGGSVVSLAGLIFVKLQQSGYTNAPNPERVKPLEPVGAIVFIVLAGVCLLLSLLYLVKLPRATETDGWFMEGKYRLFLMMAPFLILVFLFSYLPLWGWRYAFFDYKPGQSLTPDNFVGFKWFTYLFQNSATRADIVRVMTNTLAMSGIGLAMSWLPLAFAIFLTEIKCGPVRRAVQTITTIPNFISWVLVYTVAFALFSSDGFVNQFLLSTGLATESKDFLIGNDFIWLKMYLWGTWKGLGWGAIIYIAGISGIDQALYEAATIDGAGRFQKIWHITIPGLMPTFFVQFVLSISNILSNGMDQYLVFRNATNTSGIQVLDLYVYMLGLGSSNQIPLSTVVGMAKSIISVILLFSANKASKAIRGSGIV
ncbi:MAG: ABC transporter permease subunit [Lachnospiraceae bacterium]|nr:ABC transporter permease subunit [Ruminococcus sp.]MCM1275428.1 ABC transporter permease subunit [Lachnospiraceae bacterium]